MPGDSTVVMNTVNYILFVVTITRLYNVNAACSQCVGIETQFLRDAIPNKALSNHVVKSLTNLTNKVQCFFACKEDCRCMSYNFQDNPSSDGTQLCELNSADYKFDPLALKNRRGFTYYDIHPYFNSPQENLQCAVQSCSLKCCQSSPCQNGGKCHAVCGQKKRLHCKCEGGYTGDLCTIKANSCLDHFKYNRTAAPGNYSIQNDNGVAFMVFCDFDKSEKFAWTLVMSYTFANNDQFKTHPLYKDHPVAQNLPNWAAYRLSKARMLSIHNQISHWRATCNYNSDGVVLTDYIRSSFVSMDPITHVGYYCRKMEYVNIRGKECKECTIWCHQIDTETFLIANWWGEFGAGANKCSYVNAAGVVNDEYSFGFYRQFNSGHRCSSGQASTTQHWFGSGVRY